MGPRPFVAVAAVALISRCRCCNSLKLEKSPVRSAAVTTNSPPFVLPLKQSFSATVKRRSKPTIWERLERLWSDPRPVWALGNDDDGGDHLETSDGTAALPYCLSTGEFEAAGCTFECLIYPRGILDRADVGNAAAYLKFKPQAPGEEADVRWTLKLVDGRTQKSLPIVTSGGLPRSNDTWSSAMTFTSGFEAVDSVGRTADWGASAWAAADVSNALLTGKNGSLVVEGNVTVYDFRQGESTFSWPPGERGALGAVSRATKASADKSGGMPRTFRSGEVIVPTQADDKLNEVGIYPGVDYRVMTISDANGVPLFSTEALPSAQEKENARLALRPVGWKLHQQMWRKRGKKLTDWPVEIEARDLSASSLTRFNLGAFLPRLSSMIALDAFAVVLILFVATSPLPLALIGREFVSFYEIPSASMEPTLQRNDVLLVEKFPGVYDRTSNGDVVLFKPPPSLQEIIGGRGGKTANPLGGESLFVKRVVAMPGDSNIIVNEDTKEVSVGGKPAVGPDRNLCDDEPLKLIDKLLVNGKGKAIEKLKEEEVYVLGDCKAVSVDSRVFGTLPKENIVGRPIARIWPLSRFRIGGSLD